MIVGIVLTLNEEINIAKCLQSLSFADGLIVVDSYSTDKTVEIVKSIGATLVQREFDSYSNQRNFALGLVPSECEWIIMMDADEVIPDEMRIEIVTLINNASEDVSALYFRRKDIVFGRWLKRSTGYPTWAPRVFKNTRVKVTREINEHFEIDGKLVKMRSHFLHYPMNKGITWWISKHNTYSTMEADNLYLERQIRINPIKLVTGNVMEKRWLLKQVFYRLPYRPVLMFIVLFILRGGFLDGTAGYRYVRLRMLYEQMISLKLEARSEIKR